MTIKIEKNVPLLPRAAYSAYPFAQMEVGDSFAVPVEKGGDVARLQKKMSTCALSYARSKHGLGKRFATRRSDDHSCVRVWRIADRPSVLEDRAPKIAVTVEPRVHKLANAEDEHFDAGGRHRESSQSRTVKGSRY